MSPLTAALRDLNHPAASVGPDDPVAASRALLDAARAATRPDDPTLRAAAASLGAVDPRALPRDGGHRTAFWLNVYNALMRHAVLAYDLRAGTRVPLGVFARAGYGLGGQRYSLHVIEHGLLRRNRPAPYTFWRPLGASDPRAAAMPATFDVRLHFALNCAAASCPPVRAYSAEALDAELDRATRAYVTQETALHRDALRVEIPYLCGLYARDFGPRREALAWVATFLDDDDRAWIAAHADRIRVASGGYRWEVVR